jgi:hypothetical protein
MLLQFLHETQELLEGLDLSHADIVHNLTS